MLRTIAIAGFVSILLGSAPAFAQVFPDLDGAPPPLKVPAPPPKVAAPKPAPKPVAVVKPAAPKPAAKPAPKPAPVVVDKVKAAEADLVRQADVLAARQVSLDKQDAALKARAAGLDTRAADLAAREKELADQQAELAAQKAELARQSDDVARQLALASAQRPSPAAPAARDGGEAPLPDLANRKSTPRIGRGEDLDRDAVIEACLMAGEDEAMSRGYETARYAATPRFYQARTLELRGIMRVDDRRGGYRILDSVCAVDVDGEPLSFTFLR